MGGRVFFAPVLILIAGVAITATHQLALVIIGIGVVTAGFFGAHSIASACVGQRATGMGGRRPQLALDALAPSDFAVGYDR